MTQSLDKIDLLKERANISYKEAAELLEQFDGNVVEVLIHLESKREERHQKVREEHYERRQQPKKNAQNVLNEVNSTRFILKNNKNKLIDVPLAIAVIVAVITLPFSIFVLIGLAIAGNQIVIKKKGGKLFKLDQVFQVVTEEETDNEEAKETTEESKKEE